MSAGIWPARMPALLRRYLRYDAGPDAAAFPAERGWSLELARTLHQTGQLLRAKEVFEGILRAEPGHYEAWHSLGVIAGQTKNFARAVAFIGEAIEINPRSASAFNDRGVALKGLSQWDAALANYDMALAINGEYAEAHHNRASVVLEVPQPLAHLLAGLDGVAQTVLPEHAAVSAEEAVALGGSAHAHGA